MTNKTEQLSEIESEQALIKVRDEMFRKIGRNLINYQVIEQLLKQLISGNRITGPASQLEEIRNQKAEEIHIQSMGVLVGQFLDNTYQEPKDSLSEASDLKEIHFSASFHLNVDARFLESRKADLKKLTDERNNLAHHLLPRLKLNSIDSCLAISRELDAQREMQIKEHEHLASLCKQIGNLYKEHTDFIASEEGIRLFEFGFLQQSRVITMLLELSITQSRADGWTVLDKATRYLRENLADDLDKIKTYHGCKTMKSLILTSELFDILEEPTKKGGSRVLYRVKSDLADVYH